MAKQATKGVINHIIDSKDNYPSGVEVTNDKFIEWTKEIFSSSNSKGPGRILTGSVESAQRLVDTGIPAELIDVLRPCKRKRK